MKYYAYYRISSGVNCYIGVTIYRVELQNTNRIIGAG